MEAGRGTGMRVVLMVVVYFRCALIPKGRAATSVQSCCSLLLVICAGLPLFLLIL